MHKPYLCAFAAVVVTIISTFSYQHFRPIASLTSSDNGSLVSASRPVSEKRFPDILSKKDKELYQSIFLAQKKSAWKEADEAIGKLNDPLLLSYVLADRYLHKNYDTSPAELRDWLAIYADHPQAYEMYALASRKTATLKGIPQINKPQSLQGYGDDNGLASSFGNSPHVVTWHKAMNEWRKGSKLDAAKLFSSLLNDKDLPSWKVSAASFWAYRSYKAAGRDTDAAKYLHIAASEPRSFYGILARQKLGLSLDLDTAPMMLSKSDIDAMSGQPAVRRIIALTQVNRSELAEKELRLLFPQASKGERPHLLALAHDLNLASVQIAMAKQLANDDRTLDYARYPIPQWQPQNGFKVDRALLYALMRQESGFDASAVSPSGALGLMQIMPQTASFMKKRMYGGLADDTILKLMHNDSDPMFNLALGQDYVKHLLDNELVENNLLYMLTAYNAGPGRLMEWKNTIAYNNDPLLFIESIPFAETRNYVMQVMTNYWIYSELSGNPNPSIVAVLSGEWPDYMKHAVPVTVSNMQAILEKTG